MNRNKVEERLKAIKEPITNLIAKVREGDEEARDRLWKAILPLLKEKAEANLKGNNVAGVMHPSDLLQDAFLALMKREKIGWNDRIHLYAFAATAMHHIMIDQARKHLAGDRAPLPMDDFLGVPIKTHLSVIEVNEALDQLAAKDPVKARVVVLRLFGGLTSEEIAEATGLARATVTRHLTFSRAFIMSRIGEEKNVKR